MRTIHPFKTLLAHPWRLGSLRGRTARLQRERRVWCSMDSSCELLSSLDPASRSVHGCEVPCRTLRSISNGGNVQRHASGLRLSGGVRLTERTREAHRWVCVYGEARRALL
jgi:hypothetical protein